MFLDPNLPLPLVDTKGDKIKLNPALNNASVTEATTNGPAAGVGGPDSGGALTTTPGNNFFSNLDITHF